MKKIIVYALILILALSMLTSCKVKEKLSSLDSLKNMAESVGEAVSQGGDITDVDFDDLQDWAHDQGWDGEGYHFPEVESMREWPPASVWTELGLPDMTPAVLTEGEIYNDGNTHVDGYSDTFVAECVTDEASFLALSQKLWDAGINGVDAGGGRIIPAEDYEWLRDDDPNYLWYRAFYELDGEIMEVYLQYGGMDGDALWVGVTYSPSDPDFERWPEIRWPSSQIKAIIGADLPSPGGTVYGIEGDDEEYPEIQMVIEGVSEADYERYLQNLRDGGVPGIVVDSNGGSDFFGYYEHTFYHEDYDNYPIYISINYVGGVMMMSVITI